MSAQAASDSASLADRLLVASIGPIISAIVGTLIISLLLRVLSDRRDRRRAAVELKRELLTEMTKVSATLYLAEQRYWRIKNDKNATDEERRLARRTLDDQYQDCRQGAQVLGTRLEVSFNSNAPSEAWHKVEDLLTVRYFQLVERATPRLRQVNSKGYKGKEHSGLSTEDLLSPRLVLEAYQAAREDMIKVLMAAEASVTGATSRGGSMAGPTGTSVDDHPWTET